MFVLSYYVLFLYVIYVINPYMPVCFLMRDRMMVVLDSRKHLKELEGVERGETIIRICCIKKNQFSIKEKN